ncbi:DNA-processing protein DprA [Rubellicoccus peritrichatus]|uniref:DNA-processing protein DprA n=1 Tax=Rubellicoccus peritrichatus TaxID=3080537 RepID=A0AAQ3LG86_9BACT|nr:DNA-processing protein DprA [Puniceicoccus sp. CR14]WOO41584.1 DNA-processing protein DprA [Puniceicoccus sp. CR14]
MIENLNAKQALIVLNGLPSLGPVSRRRLLDAFDNDPTKVLSADVKTLQQVQGIGPQIAKGAASWADNFDLAKEEQRMIDHGVDFVCSDEDDYPPLLKEIYDPPAGIYFKGPARPKLKTVGIIGTRHCTLYGQAVAKRLGSDLARLGFCVVSGMARGIDTAAHQGALEANGETVAVLGCGVDIIYPPENLDLYRQITESGAVISELPFGTPPTRNTFPMRNRVISGISQAIVVVESAASGGSMITARFAGEHGRHLLAVPGRIDQEASQGCHQLIRDGAVLMTSIDDLLEELSYAGNQAELDLSPGAKAVSLPENWEKGLSSDEKTILHTLIEGDTLMPDKIAESTKLPISGVAATLLMLELKKRVVKHADGRFEARFSM